MTVLATLLPDHAQLALLADVEAEQARYFASKARADKTKLAYERDFGAFHQWCQTRQVGSMPADPETIGRYVTVLANSGRKVATINRHLASISVRHKAAHLTSPTLHVAVKEIMQGIRRDVGVAQVKKVPLVIEDLRRVLAPLRETDRVDVRDRALLVLGFAGAFRRSELVSLATTDLTFVPNGLEIVLRKSKTDQEREGVIVAVPYGSTPGTCPVRTMQAWLALIGPGPLFRGIHRNGRISPRALDAKAVGLIVQRRAAAVGIVADLGGHSLRAGFATSAANAGVSLIDSMRQTRHKSMAVAAGYVRRANAWDRNAAANVGL